MKDLVAEHARRLSTHLVDYLADVTRNAQRNPVRDILSNQPKAPQMVMWLDDLPASVVPSAGGRTSSVIVSIAPPNIKPAPRIPERLIGWLNTPGPWTAESFEPKLLSEGPDLPDQSRETPLMPPSETVLRAFRAWIETWRTWHAGAVEVARLQKIYRQLDAAAKETSQNDDSMELVLGIGLVLWTAPDERQIRRHVMTEQVAVTIDKATARINVALAGSRRRLEDQELFLGLNDIYHPERATDARRELVDTETVLPLEPDQLTPVLDWTGRVLEQHLQHVDHHPQGVLPTEQPQISFSPALVLRPRSRALLSEAYAAIAKELKDGEVGVPVSMAQLVAETEPADRNRWLSEQGSVSGEVLGKDPLFPLQSNDEQRRVMELLRDETGIVVQGPPGTGKTHTIANLVSALLARGQRVLVTSQKDQALRVLRDKVPPELQALCVMLAGGSGNGAQELERGLSAFSAVVSRGDKGALAADVGRLRSERGRLQARSTELNALIQTLRDSEVEEHHAIVPGFSRADYRGRLAEIVDQVVRESDIYNWFPASTAELPDRPPLNEAELLDLWRMLCQDATVREQRLRQWLPELAQLPSVSAFSALVSGYRQAEEETRTEAGNAPRVADLLHLRRQTVDSIAAAASQLDDILQRIDPAALTHRRIDEPWVLKAVEDHLSGRRSGIWSSLSAERDRAQRLLTDFKGLDVVDLSIENLSLGQRRGLLTCGQELVKYLQTGGKLKRLFPPRAVTDAKDFLQRVQVNGTSPTTADAVGKAVNALDVKITTGQLIDLWKDAGIPTAAPADRTREVLSELADKATLVAAVEDLAELAQKVTATLRSAQQVVDLSSLSSLVEICDAAEPALAHFRLSDARAELDALATAVIPENLNIAPAPEVQNLVEAINTHDREAYTQALKNLDQAHVQREQARQFVQLRRSLRDVHPRLADLLEQDAANPAWDQRLSDLPHAWAWKKAWTFVAASRSLTQERKYSAEYRETEDRLARRTAEQAAAEATLACLERMSDTHVRALRTYQEHIGHVGAGMGKRSKNFQRAARQALEQAKDAVPAWVVPLPQLLENLPPERNSFDVVIVDEASQVGMENLFLLWLAPRIIVVGDDKQCTPADNRLGKQEIIQGLMDQYLTEFDPVIRENFTEKSNLYGLMSARSGLASVVGLKEHFRCVPEIVNWSSTQFYGSPTAPGLVPLRERRADSLQPLKVTKIPDGYSEGIGTKRRNPAEAQAIVEQLAGCIDSPEYRGKSFGIIALQGPQQIAQLEKFANDLLTPEERQRVSLRIGNAANFQGDERDVIFLSMVVASRPKAMKAKMYQQGFNVAATRARDQMWLFTSIDPADLSSDDLRYSLNQYMLEPPPVFGKSPALEEVSQTEHCEPFDSLFEQKVFRKIRERGFHVVPQYPVGTRRLDLVVAGDNGRLAIECDGNYYHSSDQQRENDARRDRELNRMGWNVLRVRESEFNFDGDQALMELWTALEEREIRPIRELDTDTSSWAPIELFDDENVIDLPDTEESLYETQEAV